MGPQLSSAMAECSVFISSPKVAYYEKRTWVRFNILRLYFFTKWFSVKFRPLKQSKLYLPLLLDIWCFIKRLDIIPPKFFSEKMIDILHTLINYVFSEFSIVFGRWLCCFVIAKSKTVTSPNLSNKSLYTTRLTPPTVYQLETHSFCIKVITIRTYLENL